MDIEYSDRLVVMDSTITEANGKSPSSDGQALLTWEGVSMSMTRIIRQVIVTDISEVDPFIWTEIRWR